MRKGDWLIGELEDWGGKVGDMSSHVRARFVVQGRVQGVFYRVSACEEARRLGLGGWVRNCADGSVEAVAEGTREQVGAFLAWCRRGPPHAQVTGVSEFYAEATGEDSGFRVRG